MGLPLLIQAALIEDATDRDVTAEATIEEHQKAFAHITAKAEGLLSGITVANDIFIAVDNNLSIIWHVHDGDHIKKGEMLCELDGNLRSLLAAERTALNFLQHLSGIATTTRAFVDVVSTTNCKIADTRKTTPGLRHLEKQAVSHGGGINHRMDLASGMLIKENHIEAAGSIIDAVNLCYEKNPNVFVEVECETLDQVREAIQVCPDIILLDNMTPEQVSQARHIVPDAILLEASGNITLNNALAYAQTGVNRIAIGSITHSAPALDLSMRVSLS